MEVKAESPIYVAPGLSPNYVAQGSKSPSRGRSPSPLSALYNQVRGLDPLLTQASLEDGRKRREEESRRARARTKILDQVRGVVQATFKDPITPNRRAREESEEGQWSQKRGSSEAGSEDGEKEEQDKRRVQSASTWTPPRKRNASLRGRPMRCWSPHLCRSAAFGGCRHELQNPLPDSRSRSMALEDIGRSPTMQERMTRWPRVDNLEQARLNRAWEMVERERRTVTEARDMLLFEAGRGANAMSRMTQRVEEVMTGMKDLYCTGCRGGGGFQDREQFGSMMVRAPFAESEHGYQWGKRRSQWRSGAGMVARSWNPRDWRFSTTAESPS